MRAIGISSLLAASLAFGLSTLGDYASKPAKECSVTAENGGVTIGLEPVDSVAEQNSIFGTDLSKRGFIPVFLVVENGMASGSVIFDRSKVTYGAAASALSAPHMGVGKAIGLSFIPLAGGFLGAGALKKTARIQSSLMEQELHSTTIARGASARGFLYVPIGDKSPRDKMLVRVPIGKSGSDEAFNLDLTF